MQTSILNDMIQYTYDWLTENLQQDVSDETRTNNILIGRLQADPTVSATNLMIRNGGSDWKHERAPESHHALQFGAFSEIGGARAEFWLRRYILQLKLFFVGEVDPDVATEKANVILSRVESYMLIMPLPRESDSFGEQAIWIDLQESYLNPGGGPGMYIHQGEIRFEVLTERLMGNDA